MRLLWVVMLAGWMLSSLAPPARAAEDPPAPEPFVDRPLLKRPAPEAPSFPQNYLPPEWDRWHNPGPLARFSLRAFAGIGSYLGNVLGEDANPYPLAYSSVLETTTLAAGVDLGVTPIKFLTLSLGFARLNFKPDRGSAGSKLSPTVNLLNFSNLDLMQFTFSGRFQIPINIFNVARDAEVFSDDLFQFRKPTDLEGIIPYIKIGMGLATLSKLTAVQKDDTAGTETPIDYLESTQNLLLQGGVGIELKYTFLSIYIDFNASLNGTPKKGLRPWSDPEEFTTWRIVVGLGFHL